MLKDYIYPTVNCYTMELQYGVAASDPNKPVVVIDDTIDVDNSTKSRRKSVWDDEEEDSETNDFNY